MAKKETTYEVETFRGEGAGGEVWKPVTEKLTKNFAEQVVKQLKASKVRARVKSRP